MQTDAFGHLDPARAAYAKALAENRIQDILNTASSELQAIELELERRLLLQDIKAFVHAAWPHVEPTQKLRWNWHLDELVDVLHKLETSEYTQVIINVPPGTMKSLLCSVFFRAWLWAKNPGYGFLAASYGSQLSTRDNVKLRDLIKSPWYKRLFPAVVFAGDQDAKERFKTTLNGWSIATSVGGLGTGEHPDFVIVDDPVTEAQARSDADRESANKWIDRTLSTRGITRGVRTLVIMQRLHEQDVTGHLLSQGGWRHVCFPMRYEGILTDAHGQVRSTPDPRDKRTVPSQLLWPELFPESVLQTLETKLGPYGIASQLQQRPAPEGGGLFRREKFKIVDALPAGKHKRFRGWDTAGSDGSGDYTVGVRLFEHDGLVYIDSIVRGQLGPDEVDQLIRNTAMSDGRRETAQREEKEGGSAGMAVITARARALRGFDYDGMPTSGDKVTRSKPFRTQVAAGNVRLLRGEWNEAYLSELEHFPVGKHDDQVDATSCAYNALCETPVKTGGASWGR